MTTISDNHQLSFILKDDATTFGKMIHSIVTFSIVTLSVTAFNIKTLIIKTPSITMFGIMIPSIRNSSE